MDPNERSPRIEDTGMRATGNAGRRTSEANWRLVSSETMGYARYKRAEERSPHIIGELRKIVLEHGDSELDLEGGSGGEGERNVNRRTSKELWCYREPQNDSEYANDEQKCTRREQGRFQAKLTRLDLKAMGITSKKR